MFRYIQLEKKEDFFDLQIADYKIPNHESS